MKRLRARPDDLDLRAADAVMAHTGKHIEAIAKVITRLGDEKILLPLTLAAWRTTKPATR